MAWLRVLGILVAAVLAGVLFRSFPVLAPIVAVGGGIAFGVWWYRVRPQHKSTPLEAKRMGLRFSKGDPIGVSGYPFGVLRRGTTRRVEHVIWGAVDGQPITVFELAYADAETGGAWTRLSCAFGGSPVEPPPFVIESEVLAPAVPSADGPPEVALPGEELDELFRARCDDPGVVEAFASDASMAAFLLGLSEPWGFELTGRTLLCYGLRREPWDLHPLLSALRTFRDRIPGEIRERFPAPEADVPSPVEPGGSGEVSGPD